MHRMEKIHETRARRKMWNGAEDGFTKSLVIDWVVRRDVWSSRLLGTHRRASESAYVCSQSFNSSLTIANQMLSVLGSIQSDPFSPAHISHSAAHEEPQIARSPSPQAEQDENDASDEEEEGGAIDAFAQLGRLSDEAEKKAQKEREAREKAERKEERKRKRREKEK